MCALLSLDDAFSHAVAAFSRAAQLDDDFTASLNSAISTADQLDAALLALDADAALPEGWRTVARLVTLADHLPDDAPWSPERTLALALSKHSGEVSLVPLLIRLDPISEILDAARAFLGVHEHDGTLWFRKEPMDALLAALLVVQLVPFADTGAHEPLSRRRLRDVVVSSEELRATVLASGHRFNVLMEKLAQ